MSCAVTRMVCSERRTLPSRTVATLSLCATVTMSGCSLNENDEVRAATWSPSISAIELSNSSVSPSEKYSCSLSPLKFTNGSTAIECGGGAKATETAECFEIQKYVAAAKMSSAATASSNGFHCRDAGTRSPIPGVALDTALNGDSSDDSRCLMRSTNARGAWPPGRRVHCTSCNLSGTEA